MSLDTTHTVPGVVGSVVVESVRDATGCTYFLLPGAGRRFRRFDRRQRRTLHSSVQIAIMRCIANDIAARRPPAFSCPAVQDLPTREDHVNAVQVRARAHASFAERALYDYLDILVLGQLAAAGWFPRLNVTTEGSV